MIRSALAIAFSCFILVGTLDAQSKLLRFPDIHGDQIVFCYAGDLWRVESSGGLAVRLTAHPGLESVGSGERWPPLRTFSVEARQPESRFLFRRALARGSPGRRPHSVRPRR